MKYDDFLDARMQEAARTYLDGLERAGLEPNPTLSVKNGRRTSPRSSRQRSTAMGCRQPSWARG